jgi:cytochrome bd-type quinol oxidase subunit 1
LIFNQAEMLAETEHVAGAFLTAGVLAAGLYAFKQGNTQRSQQLMRARVVAQGVTVAIMAASVGVGSFSIKG